jgi:type II restriction enzyme
MNFLDLCEKIKKEATLKNFTNSVEKLEKLIYALDKQALIPIVTDIGAIPEDIEHDSTEEKLYARASDIVLAKCFQELGLQAVVNKKRTNCADVVAKSQFHNYSLVGDAKSFRLSRTAKNQKDFKVKSMSDWRENADYAILVCPYYQYPKSRSQIYGQALNENVILFTWEYLAIFLENGIVENSSMSIANLWQISTKLSETTKVADKNNCFFVEQDNFIRKFLNLSEVKFKKYFAKFRSTIIARGNLEIKYWEQKIIKISNYTREQAIQELLVSLKLNEKILFIRKYIEFLERSL